MNNVEKTKTLSLEQFHNDPALMNSKVSNELFVHYASLEPCQPSKSQLSGSKFPTNQQGNRLRSFHERYYFKEISPGNFMKRNWLSYSPSTDCIFCIVCKLFGLPNEKHDQFSKLGTYDWRHILYKIKAHESAPEDLQSEIHRVMYTSQLRVDIQLLSASNSQVAENREIVKIIFEALLYLVRQNNAFRGHDDHWSSSN